MADTVGIEVQTLAGVHAAVLRYFEPGGAFADAVASAGAHLPPPLAAIAVSLPGAGAGELVLAWTRPTETLVLAAEAAPLDELLRRLGSAAGGCVVEMTGGVAVLRLTGARIADLIDRLGGTGAPQPGEARRGRFADVPVLALSVRAGEVLLVVDRALAGHVAAWIGATLADFRR